MEVDPVDEGIQEQELLPVEVEPLFHASFGEYYEDDVLQLLKSNDPGDASKLKALVIEIIPTDNMRAFEFLMANGYKIQVVNDKNQTCIHLAYYAGSRAILSSSTLWSPNLADNMITCTDTNGLTFLHIACCIADAAFVKRCLNSNLDFKAKCYPNLKQLSHNGFTPLHFASLNHELSIVKLLLESGADVNAVDSEDRTPLHIACSAYLDRNLEVIQGHLDIIELLLKNHSRPSMKDKQGNVPLFSIFPDDYNAFTLDFFIHSFPEIETTMKLDLLLKQNVDFNIKNNNNESILHCIIKNLQHLRLPSNITMLSFNDTYHVEMIKKIIKVCPSIELNVKNIRGQTPLQLAVSYMSSDIVNILLEHGADVNTVKFDVIHNNHCFYYSNIVPNLESVLNIELITLSLSQNKFKISMKDKLNIMKFLVHNEKSCECYELKSQHEILYRYGKIINFGLLQHSAKTIANLWKDVNYETLLITILANHLLIRKVCKLYCSLLYANFLVIIENYIPDFQNKESELKLINQSLIIRMKATIVKNDVSLYDIMVKNPCYIHKYLKDIDAYSKVLNLANQYDLFLQDIIKGHVCHSLIKDYIERSAFDYLECLFPFFPEPCCKTILYYLDEESIVNICSAAVDGP